MLDTDDRAPQSGALPRTAEVRATGGLAAVALFAATGHLGLELVSNFLPVVYPILVAEAGFSFAQVGTVTLVATLGMTLPQPLFGMLIRRFDAGRLVIAAVLWCGLFFGLAGLAGSFWPLLALVALGGLGSALFHPAGSVVASAARSRRRGAAMSIFSVGGNAGAALSPLLLAAVIGWQGLAGTLVTIPLAAATALILLLLARHGAVRGAGSGSTLPDGPHRRRAAGTRTVRTGSDGDPGHRGRPSHIAGGARPARTARDGEAARSVVAMQAARRGRQAAEAGAAAPSTAKGKPRRTDSLAHPAPGTDTSAAPGRAATASNAATAHRARPKMFPASSSGDAHSDAATADGARHSPPGRAASEAAAASRAQGTTPPASNLGKAGAGAIRADGARPPDTSPTSSASAGHGTGTAVLALGLIVLFAMARAWYQVSLTTYLPLWVAQHDGARVGIAQVLFVLAGSLPAGAVLGGALSDRAGRWQVVLAAGVLLVPANAGLLAVGPGGGPAALLPLVAAIGCLIGATYPVAIIIAQEALPRNIGLAGGMIMGLGWLPGGVGASAVGMLADSFGLARALATGVIPLLVGVLAVAGYALLSARGTSR